MSMIPAVREPASIAPFFKALAQTTVPAKVDANFMGGIGFRRQSDVRLLELLHFLGFIDNMFQPTKVWKNYFDAPDEDSQHAILGEAVANKYADALRIGGSDGSTRLNGKSVMAFFKSETGASETETAYMALTLQILIDLAELPGNLPSPSQNKTCPLPGLKPGESSRSSDAAENTTVTLNITLNPGENPELAVLLKKVLEKNLNL